METLRKASCPPIPRVKLILKPDLNEDEVIEIIKSQDLQNETFEEAAGRLGHLRPHKRKPSYLDWLKKVTQDYAKDSIKRTNLIQRLKHLRQELKNDRIHGGVGP